MALHTTNTVKKDYIMKASEVKVGTKIKIQSSDCVLKGFEGVTGKVQQIVKDNENDLDGFNIVVRFDAKCDAGAGTIVRAEDIVAI
jgi:hypothetical protein